MQKIFFIPIIILLIFTACNKKDVDVPDFGVSTDSASYKAGSVTTFVFSGNPDNITFYSGEAGHEYQYRDVIADGAKVSVGVPLKNMSIKMDSYFYTYAEPGTYTATFVVSNTTIYGSETVVEEIEVKVTP